MSVNPMSNPEQQGEQVYQAHQAQQTQPAQPVQPVQPVQPAPQAQPAQPVVQLEQVQVQVKGRTLLQIEKLAIEHGERVAILGPNGAGKSTLLRLLGGHFVVGTAGARVSGRVQVLGQRLDSLPSGPELRHLRAQVGQVMQGLHLVARLSALDNALIGALPRVSGWRSWVRHYPPHEHARAQAALQAVGIAPRAMVRADRLSGGERQKVAIARLLMQHPQLILADEPTAALDPAAAQDICHLLAQAADGATLISVVHQPTLLPLLAKRVLGIAGGRLQFDLALADLSEERLALLYRSGQ
jgi:phosphonate transport system ATP-binding protein